MWFRVFFFFFLLLGVSLVCNATSLKIEKVLENELPSKKVWCTYQDKLGYIWIATSEGLCRYDGKELRVFTKEDGLWANGITWLSETDTGDLLVVCYEKGLNIIEIEHQPIIRKGKSFGFNYDVFLKEGYLINNYNFFKSNLNFKQRSKEVKWFTERQYSPTRAIYYKENNVLFNCKLGFCQKKIDTAKETILFSASNDSSFYALHAPNYEDTYIGALGKIYHLKNFKEFEIYEKGLPENNNINFIITDEIGNIYCNVINKGLYLKRHNEPSFRFIHEHYDLENTNINHLLLDKNGNIWAASMGKGLFLISGASINNYDAKRDLNKVSIQQLCYVPTNKELFVNGLADMYLFKNNTTIALDFPKVNNSEVNIDHLEVVEGSVFGTKHRKDYDFFLSPKYCKTKFHLKPIRNINCSQINANNIWMSSLKRLYENYKLIDDSLILIDQKHFENLPRISIFHPFYIGNNELWHSTGTTLIYEHFDDSETFYSDTDEKCFFKELFQNVIINKIDAFTTDSIWFATDEGLIGRINNEWQTIPNINRLKSKNIKDFAFDREGNIWFVTQKELGYYSENGLKVFSQKDGFILDEFNYVEYDINEEKIIVADIGGMSIVKKTDLLGYYELKNEDFIISKISIDSVAVIDQKNINLESDQTAIQFDMSLINFSSNAEPRFEYKLNDKNWIAIENSSLVLSNLKHDDYTIQFRAGKDNINWLDSQKINFKVLPDWYQTKWFFVVIVLLVLLLATLLSYFFIKRNNEIAQKEILTNKRIAFLEQRALTASMNPHFIFNVLNAIQELIQRGDVLTTNHYIAKFGNLIRLYLNSSLQATVPIHDEIERIKLYCEMEKLRFGDNISYQINVADDIDTEFFTMPGMSLQPYVENAIKHGIQPKGKGTIILNCFSLNDDFLTFEVIDDGVGIDNKSFAKKTDGMHIAGKITEERIKLFGAEQGKPGEVIIQANLPKGTIVNIKLPIITINETDK